MKLLKLGFLFGLAAVSLLPAFALEAYDVQINTLKIVKGGWKGNIYGASSYFIPYYPSKGAGLVMAVGTHYLDYSSSGPGIGDAWARADYNITLRWCAAASGDYTAVEVGRSRKVFNDDDWMADLFVDDSHNGKWSALVGGGNSKDISKRKTYSVYYSEATNAFWTALNMPKLPMSLDPVKIDEYLSLGGGKLAMRKEKRLSRAPQRSYWAAVNPADYTNVAYIPEGGGVVSSYMKGGKMRTVVIPRDEGRVVKLFYVNGQLAILTHSGKDLTLSLYPVDSATPSHVEKCFTGLALGDEPIAYNVALGHLIVAQPGRGIEVCQMRNGQLEKAQLIPFSESQMGVTDIDVIQSPQTTRFTTIISNDVEEASRDDVRNNHRQQVVDVTFRTR